MKYSFQLTNDENRRISIFGCTNSEIAHNRNIVSSSFFFFAMKGKKKLLWLLGKNVMNLESGRAIQNGLALPKSSS